MPVADSPEEIIPGWVAFLDAVGSFVRYQHERNPESLFWAIASAYQSVSNRACAEYRGAEGNCAFMDDERETEAANDLCAREIAYELAQVNELEK